MSFIKIHTNKEVAQDLNESPHANLLYNSQIQLLPFDPQPYFQTVNSDLTLSVGNDYSVFLVKCNSTQEYDVTEHVKITNVNESISIRLAYMPFDFQTIPVYLKIDRGTVLSTNNVYYSNKFLLTRFNEHLTSRIDYKGKNVLPKLGTTETQFDSIRLQFYYNNIIDATEIDTYYQISTSQTISPRVSVKEYTQWKTQMFNSWTLSRLAKALYDGNCYINQVRNYIIEGFEDTKREGRSNISESTFLTDPDEEDKINIIPVVIGSDFETIPFLSSSSQPSSTHFLSSQSEITIPL